MGELCIMVQQVADCAATSMTLYVTKAESGSEVKMLHLALEGFESMLLEV